MPARKAASKKMKAKRKTRQVSTGDGVLTHTKKKGQEITTWTRSGQKHPNTDKIKKAKKNDPLKDKEIVRVILDNRPKRMYRRADELPDPSQDAKAEVNLTTKKVGPRVSKDHLDLFNKCAEEAESGRQALEKAIELLASEMGVEPD